MLPPDTPTFDLTEEEIEAREYFEKLEEERRIIYKFIEDFVPSSPSDIDEFLEELELYLREAHEIDLNEVRMQLQTRFFMSTSNLFQTGDSDVYLLYAQVGLNAEWVGEGPAPVINTEDI